MKLKTRTLHDLAEMITGGSGSVGWGTTTEPRTGARKFPYRSSSALTDFFVNCDLDYRHSGSRVPWTRTALTELNEGPVSTPSLPSDGLVRVIQELMDAGNFSSSPKETRAECLEHLNSALSRDGLQAYLDGAGRCHVRAGQTTSAGLNVEKRIWSQKDLERKKQWDRYLDNASEDEFTEGLLVPLLQQCAFRRISVAGHKDKALEYGKDIWLKLQLPTSHFIYFAVQVKKGKIDAAGKTKGGQENVTEVLNQVNMARAHPVWDPDINKRVLVDHVYIVATGEITKQAKQFLGEKLDIEGRRQTIFMDRDDIVTLTVQIGMPLPGDGSSDAEPFF